jgi:hypothetical protein
MSNPKATRKTTTPEAQTRPATSRNRTSLKYIFLFLSWPVVLVHRYWNHRPPKVLDLIPFEKIEQDIQWYIKDTGDMLSVTLILAAFFVAVKSFREKVAVGAFLLISIIDIWHYWLWYKRNEYVLGFEFIIIIVAGLLMVLKRRPDA